ncbi:NAD(P)-dependent oxidoreductase [Paraburkholderia sp. DHOC27]|uniref:NAD-dependent epimerase/dehydratase family protein n=1 Tax=Paraburkholderia sp. DHOC27 TaxID=2303330 RepID=UPI000E3E94F7|nr:NAD(P)H-binding protein [Paraburkholderia sp. DHOC27]RFU44608.1 NAD(P)-dependent oxidoreductase [Paraburkholderia sp. DHOC27]
MSECLFLAGASGAIGRRVAPLYVSAGWRVVGTTRSPDKAAALRALGVEPVLVDVFDAAALQAALVAARPSVVVHQLTDLPPALDPSRMAEATERNARLRDEGTRNLVAAARAAGARRMVAQSVAFAYAEGPLPHSEDDPLDLGAPGRRAVSVGGVASLERQVLEAPIESIVLRYGLLYGPGTGFDAPTGAGSLHVDAAAYAAALAVTRGTPGIYNIAEEDGALDCEKARRGLGWNADWRVG